MCSTNSNYVFVLRLQQRSMMKITAYSSDLEIDGDMKSEQKFLLLKNRKQSSDEREICSVAYLDFKSDVEVNSKSFELILLNVVVIFRTHHTVQVLKTPFEI